MVLVCIRYLSYRVKLQYQSLSPEIIRNELVHVQQSILCHKTNSHRYAIHSKPTLHAQKIYQVMGEKLSANSFSAEVMFIINDCNVVPDFTDTSPSLLRLLGFMYEVGRCAEGAADCLLAVSFGACKFGKMLVYDSVL